MELKDRIFMAVNNAMKTLIRQPGKQSSRESAGSHVAPNGDIFLVSVHVERSKKGGSKGPVNERDEEGQGSHGDGDHVRP